MISYDEAFAKVKDKLAKVNEYLENFFMNRITINNQSYDVDGTNVTVTRKSIYVNGKLIVDNIEGNTVHVKWEGDLAKLNCTSCEINGNVQGNVDATSVKCGDVGGNIEATSVKCENVSGDIDAVSVKRRKD